MYIEVTLLKYERNQVLVLGLFETEYLVLELRIQFLGWKIV